MVMMSFFSRKKKVTTSLDEASIPLLLENGANTSLEVTKPKRSIDRELFKKVKRALQLKKSRMFYRTEEQIANKLSISSTSVSMIKRSSSFRQYLKNRRDRSDSRCYTKGMQTSRGVNS